MAYVVFYYYPSEHPRYVVKHLKGSKTETKNKNPLSVVPAKGVQNEWPKESGNSAPVSVTFKRQNTKAGVT